MDAAAATRRCNVASTAPFSSFLSETIVRACILCSGSRSSDAVSWSAFSAFLLRDDCSLRSLNFCRVAFVFTSIPSPGAARLSIEVDLAGLALPGWGGAITPAAGAFLGTGIVFSCGLCLGAAFTGGRGAAFTRIFGADLAFGFGAAFSAAERQLQGSEALACC